MVAEGAPEESRTRLAQLCREEGVRWDGEGAVTGVTAGYWPVGRGGARGRDLLPGGGARGKRGAGPHVLGRVGAMSRSSGRN